MQLAVADVDEAGDIAAQIEQRVHLYRCLGRTKVRPREHRQAQIDGGRIERVDGIVQVDGKALRGIQAACPANEQLCQLVPNAPIAPLVGIGQRGAGYRFAQPHVIELARLCRQADFDVAQALAPRQLSEGQDPELLRAIERTHPAIAAIARDDATKARPWHEVHDLGEQRLADVHENPRAGDTRKHRRNRRSRSSRHQAKSGVTPCHERPFRRSRPR